MEKLIQIGNNGQEIVHTNYWDTEHARRGYVFLSVNAGCFRLLLPDSQFEQLIEMRKAEYVVISRGPWPDQGRADALEIMFEDRTGNPYAMWMLPDQCDVLPGNKDANRRWDFAVWTRSGKALEMPCYFRKSRRIPCLKEYMRGGR